jgi:hypothetical protein
MPRGLDHVLNSVPRPIAISVLAGTNQTLRHAALRWAIALGMDVEQRREVAGTMLEFVGIDIQDLIARRLKRRINAVNKRLSVLRAEKK